MEVVNRKLTQSISQTQENSVNNCVALFFSIPSIHILLNIVS